MKRLALAVALAALALPGVPATASAQTYRFYVPDATMDVAIDTDGTIGVDYRIAFVNEAGVSPIDVVDIGMPADDYTISGMSGTLDDRAITDIRPSTIVHPGVEAHLPGGGVEESHPGLFTFHYSFRGLVFSDTTDASLASFQITPTWFDPSVVYGDTHLVVRFHMPFDVKPEEVLSQGIDFAAKGTDEAGRTYVEWDWPRTSFTSSHLVGASFPRRGMTGIVEVTKWDLLREWWSAPDKSDLRFIISLVTMLIFSIGYFRFTGGTGRVPWLLLVLCTGCLFWNAPMVELFAIPIAPIFVLLVEVRRRRSRRKYLPPIVSVEGGGIKRGLTAPEAAVLLEVPLSRVLAMVIFGMLKKHLLVQTSAQPLTVAITPELRGATATDRRKKAADAGVVVQMYEHQFLDAIEAYLVRDDVNASTTVNDIEFTAAVHALVESVADRLIGFDVDATKTYYRQIVERAWTEARSVGEITQRDQAIDKNLEWMIVGDDYERRFSGFGGGYVYYPTWMRTPHVSAGPSLGSIGGGGVPSVGGGKSSLPATPSFGDVSGSFAGWLSKISTDVAGTITPAGKPGTLDLSGFDKATGAMLKAMGESRGGGGGGGGGGGCACACAGCACACACAGGGR